MYAYTLDCTCTAHTALLGKRGFMFWHPPFYQLLKTSKSWQVEVSAGSKGTGNFWLRVYALAAYAYNIHCDIVYISDQEKVFTHPTPFAATFPPRFNQIPDAVLAVRVTGVVGPRWAEFFEPKKQPNRWNLVVAHYIRTWGDPDSV